MLHGLFTLFLFGLSGGSLRWKSRSCYKWFQWVLGSENDKHTRWWSPAAAMNAPELWKACPACMNDGPTLHTRRAGRPLG